MRKQLWIIITVQKFSHLLDSLYNYIKGLCQTLKIFAEVNTPTGILMTEMDS